jgi:RND superfamily putative drug exporter
MPRGTSVYVGGAPAQGVDFLDRLYGSFWWLAGVALMASFLLLARYFRSIFLAALAILLDVVSVASAYGVMALVFRYGIGQSVLGTFRSAQIEGWVPIFVFAVLFGLSMDYEVFIVARMREARLSGLSLTDAMVEGLGQTGGVVSAAAVILVAALGGLVFGHVAGLQELGVGLAAGVIIDASLIRGVILPGVMAIAHRAGWQWSKLATAPESPNGDPGAVTVAT